MNARPAREGQRAAGLDPAVTHRRVQPGGSLCAFSLLCGYLLALIPATAQPAAQTPAPQFDLTAAPGATHTGSLQGLDADGSVRLLAGSRAVRVPGADVVSLRRRGLALPAYPAGPQVVFANGDRVPLHAQPGLRLTGERLHFRPHPPLRPGATDLDPPLRAVALVWLGAPAGAADEALLLRRLLAEPQPRDLVLLRDGDRVQGNLVALGPEGCRILAGRRRVDLPLGRVGVIVLSSQLRALGLPAGPYSHLVLTDGSRLALAAARVDGERQLLRGKTTFAAAIELPLQRVAALEVRQGAAVYLSDLEPRAYEHTAFLGASWPLARDGTVAGRELRLGGATYDKGLGMHSASRLTYDLGGRYRRFETLVGLDERTGKRGRVRVAVLVDGKERSLDRGGELTLADGPVRVRLDLRGARTLTLVVRFGRFGDVQGHVNWADARLIR
jgi:hypothetical protein